jgi:hypothetical protein
MSAAIIRQRGQPMPMHSWSRTHEIVGTGGSQAEFLRTESAITLRRSRKTNGRGRFLFRKGF